MNVPVVNVELPPEEARTDDPLHGDARLRPGFCGVEDRQRLAGRHLHALNNKVFSSLVVLVYTPNDPVFSFGGGLYGIASLAVMTPDTPYFIASVTKMYTAAIILRLYDMFFIYVLSYFIALIVTLPILLTRRFSAAMAVHLPYAVTGLFIEYYMEWVVNRALVSPWAVVGWCVVGLGIGLSADLAYRFLPAQLDERWRSTLTGLVLGITNFALVLLALTFFYMERQTGPGSFLGIAYYGLPCLIVNSGFGGYTAYAVSRNV